MIIVQCPDGLQFWKERDIASWTPEFRNWWRLVRRDGRVGHRPEGPPPDGPWLPLGKHQVTPQHLQQTPAGWLDPAGFLLPLEPLTPVPPPPPEEPVEGLPCLPSKIYALTTYGRGHSRWLTDQGEVIVRWKFAEKLSQLLPDLFQCRKGIYLNRNRLTHIRIDGDKRHFVLDNGDEHTVLSGQNWVPPRLGLTSLVELDPALPARFGEYQLRDWPLELTQAPADYLKNHFSAPRTLIGNLIWQHFRSRQADPNKRGPKSYSQFWYEVVVHCLVRAGFLNQEDLTRGVSLEPKRRASEADKLYFMMYQIMDFFVDRNEFFTYRQFGFKEPDPHLTTLGSKHPHVLLVAEKEDFYEYAERLAEEFEVSLYRLSGQPWRIRSEYLAERLAALGLTEMEVIAYVDYDAGGWSVGQSVVDQLNKLGFPNVRLHYLIRQEHFTEEEKRLHTHKPQATGNNHKAKVKNWVALSGGIDGQALAIHSNHVQPFERIRNLFLDIWRLHVLS